MTLRSPIETARLVIAPLAEADATELSAITDHPDIIRRVHFLAAPFDADRARALIVSDPGFNGMRRVADGRLVGVAGAHDRGNAVEIGYWVGPAWQRRGYAREAIVALLGELRGRPVYAECDPANTVSWRFLVSLGFAPGGEPGRRPGREILRHAGPSRSDYAGLPGSTGL
ncbi:MAG TPA: GNAT family N-acetyltransferase [Acidiphilium sp.]